MSGIEVYRGFCASSYPRYVLEDYKIGLMPRGAQQLRYRGAEQLAPPGSLMLVQPGETVSGVTFDASGFDWQILALDPTLLRDASDALRVRRPNEPDFPDAVIQDSALAGEFVKLHRHMTREAGSGFRDELLESQSRLAALLIGLVERWAGRHPPARPDLVGDPAVRRAREFLEDDASRAITLDELTHVSGANSRFQLVRSFTREIGVPPHVFQTHLRVRRAKTLLANGAGIAEVALTVGFSDQSHLTRRFTPLVGVPPGAYRRAYAAE